MGLVVREWGDRRIPREQTFKKRKHATLGRGTRRWGSGRNLNLSDTAERKLVHDASRRDISGRGHRGDIKGKDSDDRIQKVNMKL